MDKSLVQQLSSQLKISPEQVVREYWEITMLQSISEEPWSASLGFKGGTALRLAYGSPRFSDDLDFTLLGKLSTAKLFSWADAFARRFSLEVRDSAEKRNTLLVEFRIRSDALRQAIRQKIEISTRQIRKRNADYELRLLSSPTTNVQVLIPVVSLGLVWEEKIQALQQRREPRDLFDLWFISQRLKRTLPDNTPRIPAGQLRVTLSKYLPSNYRKIISELEAR